MSTIGIPINYLSADETFNPHDAFLKINANDGLTYITHGETLLNTFASFNSAINVGNSLNCQPVLNSATIPNLTFNTLSAGNGIQLNNVANTIGIDGSNILSLIYQISAHIVNFNNIPDPRAVAKAWINFDGSKFIPVKNSSYNISTIMRQASGVYKLIFNTPMTDTNYVVTGNASTGVIGNNLIVMLNDNAGTTILPTTSAFYITLARNDNGKPQDSSHVSLAVFGN